MLDYGHSAAKANRAGEVNSHGIAESFLDIATGEVLRVDGCAYSGKWCVHSMQNWKTSNASLRKLNRTITIRDTVGCLSLEHQALAERARGNPILAANDLERVAKLFPESADVHRELGRTYFVLNRNQEAAAEFGRVQDCDPDDLAAHYYLSLLYRRLGQSEDADRESRLYADEKEDPAATSLALRFLKAGTERYDESLPSHVHTSEGAHVPVELLIR